MFNLIIRFRTKLVLFDGLLSDCYVVLVDIVSTGLIGVALVRARPEFTEHGTSVATSGPTLISRPNSTDIGPLSAKLGSMLSAHFGPNPAKGCPLDQ